MSDDSERWAQKNLVGILVVLSLLGEFVFRNVVTRVVGLTPLQIAAYVLGGKLSSEAVGLMASYQIDGDRGVDNWKTASNKMYNWYGLENTGIGAPLNLIPNPIGIGEVLLDSGIMIGEATLSSLPNEFTHGSFDRYLESYLHDPSSYNTPHR